MPAIYKTLVYCLLDKKSYEAITMSETRSNNNKKTFLVVGWATTNSAVISGNPPLKFSAREIPASPGDGSGLLWLMVRVCILLPLFLFRLILITCHLHGCTNDFFSYALNLNSNLERRAPLDKTYSSSQAFS